MRDFKNLFNIIFKRFGIWILLLSLLIATINGIQTKSRLENDSRNLKMAVADLSRDTGIEIDNDQKLSKDYFKEADKIADVFAKKHGILTDDQREEMTDDEYEAYLKKQESDNPYNYWDKDGTYRTYINIKANSLDGSMGSGAYIEDMTFGILLLVGIISMLMTSLEQSLAYYDFSLMFPWKKKDEVWLKAIIVFIIGMGIFLVNHFVNIFMITASDFAPLFNISSLGDSILKLTLLILATSIISVATGMISGNFIGHGGLMIIAIGSIELIKYIVEIFINIFSSEMAYKFNDSFRHLTNATPEILKPFFSLIYVDMTYKSIFAFIIIAIIWAILAYLVNGKYSSEKSGQLILSKPFKSLCKVIGTMTLTSLLYIITSATITGRANIIIQLFIYALALLISIKLFDILFKVRLKF